MLIPRAAMARRTVLRGLGTALALPLMEAMVPTARASETLCPKRLSVFYTPNGMMMQDYRPANAASLQLTPTLAPLAPFRDRIAVFSGLGHPSAAAMGDRPAGHGRSCPAFLTGVHVRQTEGSDIRCGISMDQVFARHLGNARLDKGTPLSSLELGIEQASLLGSCDIGYSCAYTNGIAWLGPTVPLPVTANPAAVFERLFGDGDATDVAARRAQLRRQASLLDFVQDDAKRLAGGLGQADRHRLDEFIEATRDIERRVTAAMASPAQADVAGVARPAGIPESFAEHVRLMIDLQVLALRTDQTRVVSFMTGREISNRTYAEIDVPDSHHMLSHHGSSPEKMAKLARINHYHMELFAYLLKRLAETQEGDHSLLDTALVLRGSAFGDPNEHDFMDLPVIVAGGLVPGGRHVTVARGTPMANLLLAMLQVLGVPAEKFGDSTGALGELAHA